MADILMTLGRIVNGVDAFGGAVDVVWELGEETLIVADGMMRKLGNLGRLTNMLEISGIRYMVRDGISREPDNGMILHGLSMCQKKNCDLLIMLGGGSPVDFMRAITMLTVCDGGPADYMGRAVTRRLCPMTTMPTTAGIGSEATQFTVIINRAT